MKLIKTIALDFDGVLLDSVPVKDAAFYNLFRPYGADNAKKVLTFHQNTRGIYRKEKLRLCYKKILGISINEDKLNQKVDEFATLVIDGLIDAQSIIGTTVFLENNLNVHCYIVSAAPQDEVQFIASKRGIANYFKKIYGGPIKKKEHLQTILDVEGISPSQLLFIGDSLSDCKAAQFCGVNFIGIVSHGKKNPFTKDIKIFPDLNELNEYMIRTNFQ